VTNRDEKFELTTRALITSNAVRIHGSPYVIGAAAYAPTRPSSATPLAACSDVVVDVVNLPRASGSARPGPFLRDLRPSPRPDLAAGHRARATVPLLLTNRTTPWEARPRPAEGARRAAHGVSGTAPMPESRRATSGERAGAILKAGVCERANRRAACVRAAHRTAPRSRTRAPLTRRPSEWSSREASRSDTPCTHGDAGW